MCIYVFIEFPLLGWRLLCLKFESLIPVLPQYLAQCLYIVESVFSIDVCEMNERMNICQVLILFGADVKRKYKNDLGCKMIIVVPG